MKQNSIDSLPLLNPTNYENIFNIYQDKDNRYYYNLLQSIILPTNLPDSYFESYSTTPGDTWPYISYKTLGRIDLWWIIAHFNNIENPTISIDSGITLRIPKVEIVNVIIDQLQANNG